MSANPGGRPKGALDVIHAAREKSADALNVLHTIALDKGAPAAARVSAATAIMERAWGKPVQPIAPADDDPALKTDAELNAALACVTRLIEGEVVEADGGVRH